MIASGSHEMQNIKFAYLYLAKVQDAQTQLKEQQICIIHVILQSLCVLNV